jgi:hypothetical protein
MDYKLKQALDDFREMINGAVNDLVEALDENESTLSAPAPKRQVQARLRDNVLHIQYGVKGDYQTADVEISPSEPSNLAYYPSVPSLARNSSRAYVQGVIQTNGSLRFGNLVVSSPFWTPGSVPQQ